MFDRMLSLVVAVGLALLVWLYTRSCDKVYELTEVPVHFLCPANFSLRPKFYDKHDGRISLRVRGPERNEPPKVYAFVDLIRGHNSTPGRYHEPIQLQLPKNYELVQEPPAGVSFQLTPLDGAIPAP
ncbi:MAG TPA: hypothetical protein VMF69_05505 [Gemmataceae bacterium]|nr:hypothetical protein [Gemmataceae bacterium]